jgi:predicted transcriptional regulator
LELVKSYFNIKSFDVTINDHKLGTIGAKATNSIPLLALSLKRQREKSGSTMRDAAHRLGTSVNAYAQYERGKTKFSFDQYERLRQAANPLDESFVRVT